MEQDLGLRDSYPIPAGPTVALVETNTNPAGRKDLQSERSIHHVGRHCSVVVEIGLGMVEDAELLDEMADLVMRTCWDHSTGEDVAANTERLNAFGNSTMGSWYMRATSGADSMSVHMDIDPGPGQERGNWKESRLVHVPLTIS